MHSGLSRFTDSFTGDASIRIRREKEANSMLAQQESITIIPIVSMSQLNMASGTYGPFYPMIPATVPLYIALFLKHSRQCTIQAPEWLSVKYLREILSREEESPEEFTPINMYLFDNAYICLTNCDISDNTSEIRLLLSQLKEIRLKKLLKGIQYIDTPTIGTNNLTFYEFRKIKEYLLPHLEIQKRLTPDPL
ncbi:GINS complex subunit 2 [Nematocida sp. AWRm80]|nr:GINS complex subunit 2 [Nematocida sp. AWRm80]